MSEIDVPDYLRLAAENFDYVVDLATKLSEAILQPDQLSDSMRGKCFHRQSERIKQLLNCSEYHDAMAVVASVHGMKEDDWFNDIVLEWQNRHMVRNQCGHVFNASMLLAQRSKLRETITDLMDKLKDKYKKEISDGVEGTPNKRNGV